MTTQKANIKESNFSINKTIIQWTGVLLSLGTLLIAIGTFKSDVETMQTGFKDHCTMQNKRDQKVDDALNHIAISAERLSVHIELLTKTVDELKTEIKKRN